MQQSQNLRKGELLVLEALHGAAAIVDKDGDFIASNKSWKNNRGGPHWFNIDTYNENYFTHCREAVEKGDDNALKLIFGLRDVLDGERDSFEMTATSPGEGGKLWHKVTVSALGDSKKALIVFDDISENMQSLHEFRDSKERYVQQFVHSLSGIIISAPNGDIVDVNPAACNILGFSKEELIDGGYSLILPESVNFASSFEEKGTYIKKDGSELSVDINSVHFRNKDGEFRYIHTFQDNTQVERAEKDLVNERRFTSLAVNSIPGVFFVLDKEMNLIRWNQALIEDLGYSEKNVRNMSAIDFIVERDQERVLQVVADIFKTGTGHIITEVYTKEKESRHYHLYANRFTNDGKDFIVGTGIDITGLVESEKERYENYELLSQLFNNSPMAMVMINPENKVLKANDSFVTLFSYEREEVLGENVNELISLNNNRDGADKLTDLTFSGQRHQTEGIRYTKHGEPLTVLINTVPITSDGEVIAVYGIYVDLTAQKMLEKQIQNSLSQKEVLLQEVHHRVKNNLAIMAGLLDLQILEEIDANVSRQLHEVRSRVFSIAKIHEILYQEKDVTSIRFDKYLKTLTEAVLFQRVKMQLNAIPLTLNLNQAVPFGLALNELFNLVLSDEKEEIEIKLNLSVENAVVKFSIEGKDLNLTRLDKQLKTESFQDKLIDIFLTQMGGTLELSPDGRKKITIYFKKVEMRGSSSSLKSSKELYDKIN